MMTPIITRSGLSDAVPNHHANTVIPTSTNHAHVITLKPWILMIVFIETILPTLFQKLLDLTLPPILDYS